MLCKKQNSQYLLTGAAAAFLCLSEASALSTLIFAAASVASAILSWASIAFLRRLGADSTASGVILSFSVGAAAITLLSSATGESPSVTAVSACGMCAAMLSNAVRLHVRDNFPSLLLRCAMLISSAALCGILREVLTEGTVLGIHLKLHDSFRIKLAADIGGGIILSFISLGAVYMLLRGYLIRSWAAESPNNHTERQCK